MAIKRDEISAQIGQVEKLMNAAKQMIGWNGSVALTGDDV